MFNDLRKVKFFEERPQGFDPDEQDYDGDTQQEREGYFHRWVEEERQSPESDLFREETVALIEDAATGRMYHVDYDLFNFIERP